MIRTVVPCIEKPLHHLRGHVLHAATKQVLKLVKPSNPFITKYMQDKNRFAEYVVPTKVFPGTKAHFMHDVPEGSIVLSIGTTRLTGLKSMHDKIQKLKQDGITLAQIHFENNHNFYVDMRTAVQADVELQGLQHRVLQTLINY